jgi:hypothetical protein
MDLGAGVTWSAVLLAMLVSHALGDFLLQTDGQARNKGRGLGDAAGRRALALHVGTYTLACVPALIWIGAHTNPGRAVAVGAAIALPHLIVDDGRVVDGWLRVVKRCPDPSAELTLMVDQSLHLICLFGAALLAVA